MPGVIFDMDGVLVASGPAHAASWKMVAAEHGLSISDAEFQRTFGRQSADIIRLLWGRAVDDEQVRAIDDRKEAIYRDLVSGMVPLTVGVRETLTGLRDAGMTLSVATSGPLENVDLVLDEGRLRPFFSTIVTRADIQRGKPAPDCFLLAAERSGLKPGECVVVEDAPVGVEAAVAAGIACIAFVSSNTPASLREAGAARVVERMSEITPMLARELIAEPAPASPARSSRR